MHARNIFHAGLIAGALLTFGACLVVHTDRDPRRADAYFERASKEIARLEANEKDHPRRPHRLCVLVRDDREGTVVRVSVPLWLVNWGLDIARKDDADEHDMDVRKRYDFDWKAVRNLAHYGRGLLASVEEERSRVLVWLE